MMVDVLCEINIACEIILKMKFLFLVQDNV